jgi:hypothetical protein
MASDNPLKVPLSSQEFQAVNRESSGQMILKPHMPFYREIFAIPGFLRGPVITFGYQRIEDIQIGPQRIDPFPVRLRRFIASHDKPQRLKSFVRGKFKSPVPQDFKFRSLNDFLVAKGYATTALDYFDPRADLRYDMNRPIPESEHGRYATMIDIGSIEHLFDTAQCIENCLRMVSIGGHYMLTTTIHGYYGHGLHVFNPQGLVDCVTGNGFRIVYLKYSTIKGKQVLNPRKHRDVLIWLVGKKEKDLPQFVCPQQTIWATDYYPQTTSPSAA